MGPFGGSMLYLNQNDLLKAVTPSQIIEAVERALLIVEEGGYLMPDRMHIDHNGNTLLLMPSFAIDRFGTKLVSVFPENNGKDLPVVIGTMVLNDGNTGEPLAILNGTVLTALRTGAAGAVGLKYLSSPNTKTLGIVGAGVQGFNQALFCSYVRDLTDIYIYDTDIHKTAALIHSMLAQRPGIALHGVKSVDELLENSQAVIAATRSTQPVLPDNPKMLKDKCFIGIGSFRPHMREFPRALFQLVKNVYVDTIHALKESGDLVMPIDNGWLDSKQVVSLGKRIQTTRIDSIAEEETTFFKSVGMALFDLFTSELIFQEARKKGIGTDIEM